MSKNILIVESAVKLKLELDNLLIEINDEEGVHPIKDIECLIIDNGYTSLSVRLLEKLAEFNVPMIITNKKHLPCGYYFPIENHARCSKVLKKQIEFFDKNNFLWNKIVKAKIKNQAKVIKLLLKDIETFNKINELAEEVKDGDITNREGHSAKIYFNRLMNCTFSRGNDEIILNVALNYGYAIIRSLIAKYSISYGLNLQLGIHHKSEYNEFNLADDLMEPFRPIVDLYCYKLMKNQEFFKNSHRKNIVKIIYNNIEYDNKFMEIGNVINNYIMQIARLVTSESDEEIKFPDVEKTEFAIEDFEFEEIEENYELMLFGDKDNDEV